MTESESANIEQAIDGAFRTAITQAAALGRMVAQMREQAHHRAVEQDRQLSEQLRQRYEAERTCALVTLSAADHDGWWNTASTQRVASVVATAYTWRDKDPEIARLATRVDQRAQARWDISPSPRIQPLSQQQRHAEAVALTNMLDLDSLDADDPLHTIIEDAQQPRDEQPQMQDEPSQHQQQPCEAVRTQDRSQSSAKSQRETELQQFEQMLRDNGLSDQAIEARMFPERANARSAYEAATAKPDTTPTVKARAYPEQNKTRDIDLGR